VARFFEEAVCGATVVPCSATSAAVVASAFVILVSSFPFPRLVGARRLIALFRFKGKAKVNRFETTIYGGEHVAISHVPPPRESNPNARFDKRA
jgi:hypothetical protein